MITTNVIKEEVRNTLGGNVIFIESELTEHQQIQSLVDRYFGRGVLFLVFHGDIEIVANIKGALNDEYIVRVTYFKISDGVIPSTPQTDYYIVSAEEAQDQYGQPCIRYACVKVDDEFRAGSSELRTKEIVEEPEKKKKNSLIL